MTNKLLIEKEIKRVADDLIKISFNSGKHVTWYNIYTKSNSANTYYNIGKSGLDLSDGLLGEMIFYYTLYDKFGDCKYLFFAEKIYNHYVQMLKDDILFIDKIGLLHGYGGIIYTFTLLYSIIKDIKFLNVIENLLDTVDFKFHIMNIENLSIVEGCAGLSISLSKFHKYSNNKPKTEELINLCIQRLIDESKVDDSNQMFWDSMFHNGPLCGLAHGSSGFALTFHNAYEVLKKPEYLDYIKGIILFENSFLLKKELNWIDKRKNLNIDNNFKTFAWSHGSPGIGLVRSKLLKSGFYDQTLNDILRNDINIAVEGTILFGLKDTKDILIYGVFGNIDLLINEYSDYDVEKTILEIIHDRNINGWNYGYKIPNFIKPGFMQGHSGIGYQLLRVLDKNIKSVLVFD